MVDTVKRVDDARVLETIRRDDLVVVQTPQAFTAAGLRDAHRDAPDASDDAALVEAAGGCVMIVPGEPRNVKITTPFDLRVVRAWLATEEDAG